MSLTGLKTEMIARTLYPGRHVAHVCSADAPAQDLVDQYQRDGYLALDPFLSPEEVATAQQALSDLIAGRITGYNGFEWEKGIDPASLGKDREPSLRKLWSFVANSPVLNDLSRNPRLLKIIEKLVGSPVTLIQDMALLKPPHIGGEKPWHQDNAYFLMEPLEKVLGVWIAMDRATPENGCMHIVPGTHLLGPAPHYHDRDCQLPDETVDVARDTVVPLAPGGVLIFSSLLHHGTPANKSADRRRAVQFHYAATDCTRMSNDQHKALFQNPARPDQYTGCATHLTQLPMTKIAER